MRFSLSRNVVRVMGITGLFLVGYIVVIGIFGRTDVTGWLPIKLAASVQEAWPQMPFFSAEQQSGIGRSGEVREVYYTVPTRQLTPQEIARIGKPVPPTTAKESK